MSLRSLKDEYIESASRQSVCSLLYSCFVWAEYIKLQCARLKPREEWYYGCELYMCLNVCFMVYGEARRLALPI